MEENQEANMSLKEFRKFVVRHPEITQGEITFATPISEREKEEIIGNFAESLSAIRETMSDLITNKDNCVRDALTFAYSREKPKLEFIKRTLSTSDQSR